VGARLMEYHVVVVVVVVVIVIIIVVVIIILYLYRLFTITYLKEIMSVGHILVQLFCGCNILYTQCSCP
jgi:Na+/glutamate symporter